MYKIGMRLNLVCILLSLVGYASSAYGKGEHALQYKMRDELTLSTPDMNCNYQSEDIAKVSYNFEYPKLVLSDNENPLVIFPDIGSKNLIFAEIAISGAKTLKSFSINDMDIVKTWPMISAVRNNIYLALFSKDTASSGTMFRVLCYDRKTSQVTLQEERLLTRGGLWGTYPFFDKFMLIGEKDYFCLRQLPRYLLKGGMPIFRQNYSTVLDESNGSIAAIEEEGCHSVSNQAYDISASGEAHAVWIRYTLGIVHDEAVYYSVSRNGSKWIDPIKLYAREETKNYFQINNLSVASAGNSALVLWQDRDKGIFFAEILDGRVTETTKISGLKKVEISQEPLNMASTLKIASDKDGNAYALWAQNSGNDYKLFLKTRINGKWSEEIVINSGSGYLKLPDMEVDTNGAIHITYTKPVNPNEVRRTIGVGPYGCYYLKLEVNK